MTQADAKYDDILWTIATQTGGVPEFLAVITSFLRRRTDFFSGSTEKQREALLLKIFREEFEKKSNERISNKSEVIDKAKVEENPTYVADVPTVAYSSNDAPTEGELSKPIQIAADETETEEIGKLIPNAGNGCTLLNYSWTQTLREIELKVPLNNEQPLRSRDVNVNIAKKSLTVGIKGQLSIIDGELSEEIRPNESTWMLQDGKVVSITLEKRKNVNWWEHLMTSDPVIAVRKIVPESSKLSDLDAGTRVTVEKMLYNQRQKQLGLPTSEDQEKMKILEKFKREHPELDFSKCTS